MVSRKKVFSPFRYFKARLLPFRKPMFLGSVGTIILLGVSYWQYSIHPEWRQNRQDSELPEKVAAVDKEDPEDPIANSELSQEELAGVADIDNLQVLLDERKKNSNSQSQVPQTAEQQNLLDRLLKEQKTSTNSAKQQGTDIAGLTNNSATDDSIFSPIPSLVDRDFFSSYNSSFNNNSNSNNLLDRNQRNRQSSLSNSLSSNRSYLRQPNPLQQALIPITTPNSTSNTNPQPNNNSLSNSNFAQFNPYANIQNPQQNNYAPGNSGAINGYGSNYIAPYGGNYIGPIGSPVPQPNNSNPYLRQPQYVNPADGTTQIAPNVGVQNVPQGLNSVNPSMGTNNPRLTSNLRSPGEVGTRTQRILENRPNFNNYRLQANPAQQPQPYQPYQPNLSQPNLNTYPNSPGVYSNGTP
jgi:hypothetical protein